MITYWGTKALLLINLVIKFNYQQITSINQNE